MTSYEVAKGLVLPAPIGGMNTREPLAAMNPSYCTWLENADAENQYIRMRGGYRNFCSISPSGASAIKCLALGVYGTGNSQKLFAFINDPSSFDTVYDVSSGTASSVFVTTGSTSDAAIWVNYKSLGTFVNEETSGVKPTYDGATWANAWVSTATYPSPNKTPYGAWAWYKSRLYIAPLSASTVDYGDINQVTGTISSLNSFPVGSIFLYDSRIAWMASFSQSDGLLEQDFLAFGNYAGEVLIYTGDYPSSSSWRLAGKFLIGEPVFARSNPVVPFRNDAFIITKTALISLRDLLAKGNQIAVEQAISTNIDSYWVDTFKQVIPFSTSGEPTAQGVYSERKRKVYILKEGYLDSTGTFTTDYNSMLVYNTDTGAWSVHRIIKPTGTTISNLVCFKGDIYFSYTKSTSAAIKIVKLDEDTYLDEDYYETIDPDRSIPMNIYSAYSVYGEQQAYTKVNLYQPIVEHDLPQLELSVGIDFGVAQTDAADIGYTVAGVSKPTAGFGCDGTFFQYRIEGESSAASTGKADSTEGFKFYSMNASVTKGGPL